MALALTICQFRKIIYIRINFMQFSAYSNPPTSHQEQDHLNIPQYIIELTRSQSIYYSLPCIFLLTFKVKSISSGIEGFRWLETHTMQIQKYKFPSNLSSRIQALPTSSVGEGNGTSVLLSGKSMDRGAWQAAVHEVTKSETRLK